MARLRGVRGRGFAVVMLAAMLPWLPGSPASADLVTLTDLNSSVQIETSGASAGAFSWIVDGGEQLAEQSFWYRVGDSGPESNIGTLTQSAIKVVDSNFNAGNEQLLVLYTGSGFTITVNYLLTGGVVGSGTADLLEVVTISNTGNEPLDFHFFQYANFDLNQLPGFNFGEILGGNTARQFESGTVAESVDAPMPSFFEVGLVTDSPSIKDRLTDGNPTTLSNVAGPIFGDVAWAFQWDRVIPVGGSLIVSKDKHLSAVVFVPEPATVGLLALGGLSLLAGAVRRRRRN